MNFKQVFLKYCNAALPHCHALFRYRGKNASVGFVITLPLIMLSYFVVIQVWPSLYSQSNIDIGMRGGILLMDVREVSVAPRIPPKFGSAERLAMDSLEKWALDDSVNAP